MTDSPVNLDLLLAKLKRDGLAHKLVTIVATNPPEQAERAMRALLEMRQREHTGEVAHAAPSET